MKKGFISKSYALIFFFSLLLSVSIASQVYAEVNPGFNRYIGIPLTPEEQAAKEESQLLTTSVAETAVAAAATLPANEREVTPEIQELARALKNDPILIYEYVRNNIDYVPIFGSINGATGALLAGRGSDYDQVSLFLALIEASGFTNSDGRYYYASVTYPADKVANWIGVNKKAGPICDVFANGGISIKIDSLSCTDPNINPEYVPSNVTVKHVYARVTINSVYYYFDPSFKEYTYTPGINLSSAMSYDQTSFLSSAGGVIAPDYVQNLNEGNISNSLNTYSNNLVSYIKANKPNAYTKEIIGAQEIIPQSFQSLDSFKTFPYPKTVFSTLSYVPNANRHKLTISYRGISKEYLTYQIYGKRISIFHTGAGNAPELRIDGELDVTGSSCTTGSTNATLTVNTPYGSDSGIFRLTCGYSYSIAHDFEGISAGLIKKRNNELKKNRLAGLSDTSEPVLGEGLYLMGLNWIYEKKIEQDIAAELAGIVYIEHHTVGIVAQEAGYYIDVKVDTLSATSKNNDDTKEIAWFFAMGAMGSAFEHGVIEQFQSDASASTVKILQLANNQGQKIFNATLANWNTIKNSGELQNYTSFTELDDLINSGYTITLPQNAKTRLNQWEGLGYIAQNYASNPQAVSAQYAISGNFFGGYCSIYGFCTISVPELQNRTSNYVAATPKTNFNSSTNAAISTYKSPDPVSMVTGDYLFDSSDLSLGMPAPNGLNFARSYNSSVNLEKGSLGFGWRHNYEITLEKHSDGPSALGERSPVDTASAIAGLYAIIDILYNNINNDRMMISALSSKWTVDSLIDNAVTVKTGNKTLEFIQLADGSFNPPPGVSSELIKNGDNTYTLKERYGIELKFEPDPTDSDNKRWRISTWKDADNNPLTFTYDGTSGLLNTVADAFGRTLTLNYTGDKLTSVSDSTGRSVSYGYTNDDLITYTDPELKPWTYVYDDPNHSHRMTKLINPLTITTATNAYDSLGRVKTQTVPRRINGIDTTVIYNFYFSGFRNMEEDPDNKTLIYYFDNSGRLKEFVDALGNSTKYEYDGQNHITKVTDARNYATNFLYDGNHNLTKTINALTQSTNFKYDSQFPFRLTDTIDPLNHGTFIDYDTEHHITLTRACNYSGTTCNPVIAGDGNEIKTSATYRADGLPETATDARLTVTTLTYDSYGNPYTAKTAAHPVLTTNYNTRGWLTSLTDQVNAETTFPIYNNRGQLKKKTDPLLKDTILEYDDAGRLSYVIDRNNQTITYSYTPTSKIDTITYPDTSTVHYTYNQHDDLTGMQDWIGNTSYTYDAAHRLISQTDANGFTVAYSQYDAAGNLTELTYPGNKKVIYTYDELNRLKTVKIDWLNQTATYYYDDGGRLISLTNFNNTVTTYGYDNANRLTTLENKKFDANVIASYSFTLDGNGNRTQTVQTEPLTLTPNTETVSYGYNTQKNRLMTANTISFGYDDEGQLATGYSSTYTFDYEHRLKTIGGDIQFSYDGAGKRLKAVRSGVTTKYIYDAGGNLLAEADNSGTITKYYIHGLGLLAMVTPADEVYVYHFNAVGSTVAMTDASQAIVNKYSYDPFGNIAANSVENVPQPFKFVGQFGVMTEPNGFYYMRARYYDPSVGRFISEDPLGFDGGINLYVYAGNDPTLLIDPTGLVNWERMFWGAVETSGGIIAVGIAATAEITTVGAATAAAVGLAGFAVPAIIHGTTEMIVGAFETTSNPIPKIPSASAPSLGALVATGNVQTAEKVDLISNLLSFGKTVATAGVGNKSLWEGIGAATDFISLTNQLTSSSCGRKCGQ